MADVAAVADADDEAATFGVYGPGAKAPSRDASAPAVGRRAGVLGRAHGELAGAAGGLDEGWFAAVTAPAAAAAAPAVATPGVTELVCEVGVAAGPELGDAVSDASSADDVPLPASPNAPVRAPAALAGADFFRPSRSRIDFFGDVLSVDAGESEAPEGLEEALPGTGPGPGWGDGTGEAEPDERGADAAEPAEPDEEPGPDEPGADAAGPVTGVAEAAERAE